MPDEKNGDEAEMAKQRQQNIVDNSHIAAWFFNEKFKEFLKSVLIPQWDLENW